MDFFKIIFIALALAADAFAVSVASGIALCQMSKRQVFRLSFHFGLFQAGMNIIGWSLGLTIRSLIENYDHWVAFVLLGLIGGKMLLDGLKNEGEPDNDKDPTRGLTLVVLSVATSIDALAVGLSFAVLKTSIWFPALLIGVVAALMTALGTRIGCMVGSKSRIGAHAEIFGGLVLVGIGISILQRHGVW
ncbi:MAG: manganese efflux pump MntP family protein [Desulfobulbaceae bacterium]|nr:manganese efflux pump MntP family protein [Desulfobulbaceae bacterium]